MIDYDQISSTLRNLGEGKHKINKKEFEEDWTNRSITKKDLTKKYNLKNEHDVDKFATECNLGSRYSWEARFEKNKDKEVRKNLNHVYGFNDIGISINKIEESGIGSRKKILEMIDSGYLVLGDSTLKNEKVIFLNPKLQPRFFSVDLRKLKQMYLNPQVTTNAISNRLGLDDITSVSRIANCIDLPIREHYNEKQFFEKKNKFEKLWNDPLKTNEQIANLIRITGDDITPLNQDYAPILANRINALNAIKPEALNLPAITFDKIIKKDNNGNIFSIGLNSTLVVMLNPRSSSSLENSC